jgi:hypothetical protein
MPTLISLVDHTDSTSNILRKYRFLKYKCVYQIKEHSFIIIVIFIEYFKFVNTMSLFIHKYTIPLYTIPLYTKLQKKAYQQFCIQ